MERAGGWPFLDGCSSPVLREDGLREELQRAPQMPQEPWVLLVTSSLQELHLCEGVGAWPAVFLPTFVYMFVNGQAVKMFYTFPSESFT